VKLLLCIKPEGRLHAQLVGCKSKGSMPKAVRVGSPQQTRAFEQMRHRKTGGDTGGKKKGGSSNSV